MYLWAQNLGIILQKKDMDRRDTCLSGVRGERTNGLPRWKRLLDLALIVAMSPGLLIFGAGVALLVMCSSRGPVLFRQ